ncbi:hypothetical protein GDO86_000675 [Hymenochirus boettgeri]|uniref:tRNA-binding domain-containing protein n=1 Tax=Hymenochirus boettgeri TaxID=247094 RepID=A0A8T2KHQ4_9PIPI|nr:hypothetical protein GDO86_000675 [Hymenochirus boettgeri]
MFLARSARKMASSNPAFSKLDQRASEADQIIEYLKQQVALLKEKAILQASVREEKKLRVENAKLKKEIEALKEQLVKTEIKNGVKQIGIPASTSSDSSIVTPKSPPQPASVTSTPPTPKTLKGEKKKDKAEKKGEKKPAVSEDDLKPIDVSRLDLRVGCILSAKKHPDADSLYIEEMQNRMAVLLCNLKPAKMRGVLSQAMVMCASSPEKVEILDPPSGAVPGDRIIFHGFPGEPDKELNPKKKTWEQIQPDLLTNKEGVATYKGVPFEVKEKGVCKAQTMSGSSIK